MQVCREWPVIVFVLALSENCHYDLLINEKKDFKYLN